MIKASGSSSLYPNSQLAERFALDSLKTVCKLYSGTVSLSDSVQFSVFALKTINTEEAASILFSHFTKEFFQDHAKKEGGSILIFPLLRCLKKEEKIALISYCVEPEVATQMLKDELLHFEDITEIQTRHKLEKSANSNNPSERVAAYAHIFAATEIANNPTHTAKTLTWFQKKIANEAISRRVEAFNCVHSSF